MAYLTGTSTGPKDLLQKLGEFAILLGWTAGVEIVGSGYQLHIVKGFLHFNFRAFQNETSVINGTSKNNTWHIVMNGSDSFSALDPWDGQVGAPARTAGGNAHAAMINIVGPYTAFHFFGGTSFIHVELEVSKNKFQRMGFGQGENFSSLSGNEGAYFYGSAGSHTYAFNGDIDANSTAELFPFRAAGYSTSTIGSSFVRVAVDSFDGWACSALDAGKSQTDLACYGGGIHDFMLRESSADPINATAVLLPNVISINRGSSLSPICTLPYIRQINMKNISPGDEFTLGSDTWKVFPWYEKGGWSGNRGIAHKKVA